MTTSHRFNITPRHVGMTLNLLTSVAWVGAAIAFGFEGQPWWAAVSVLPAVGFAVFFVVNLRDITR